MVIGVLLLVVTVGDMAGFGRSQKANLAAPAASVASQPTAVAALLVPTATMAAAADTEVEEPMPRFASAPSAADGTTGGAGASQGVLADQQASSAPRQATVAVASVTGAVRTPVAGEVQNPASTGATTEQGQPSRLRLLQIALALAFVWLVVSIVGLRRIRA
jgi:hypothetical protein